MKHLRKGFLTLLALFAISTGAWAQTEENIFQYCYDCQRNPAYPKTTASASLSGFQNPYVGYKGIGIGSGNTSDGPWKLEYMGIWSSTDNHGVNSVSTYQSIYSCTDVPVFRLYQWNATANEYQHAAYGVVCCYAKVSNAVEHTALFVAEGGWGCVLTNSSHSSSMNITFDEDLTTGLTTIIAGATPAGGGAGASAQGPTTVFEVDFSSFPATATTGSMRFGNGMSPSSVRINNNVNKIRTIQIGVQYNYSDNRYFSIKPETGSFKTGDTLLIAVCYNNTVTKTAAADIYAANGTTKLFTTAPGINGYTESGDPVVEKFVLGQDADSLMIGGSSSSNDHTYVTTLKVLRPAVIELTKTGANQWTLAETPDYDLELQVEYYQKYALKDIPEGWTVLVNGVEQQQPYLGDSLMITETDSVELVPPADVKPNVKSVTLVEPAPAVQTVDIDGLNLLIAPGDTWKQIAQRNNGVIDASGNGVWWGDNQLQSQHVNIQSTSTYDSSLDYSWYEW